jgi:hypothetical protein
VHTYLAGGDRVVAFEMYSGIYRQTGKAMQASFVHLCCLEKRPAKVADGALNCGARVK